MHVQRRLRRILWTNGRYERTAALLLWALLLGAPLPLGANLDAFALNTVGLGAGVFLIRRLIRGRANALVARRTR